MIHIGIDPNLFYVGSMPIGWHGIMVVLAVVVGVVASLWRARGSAVQRDVIFGLAPWAIIGGVIGARLVHVIDYMPLYADNPAQILQFWVGLSIFGAILGGTLAAVIYARVTGTKLGQLADVVAPALILAQAVGRIGCTINGDAFGIETTLPWAFVYTHPDAYALLGVPTHPSPVYEIIWDLLVFGLLLRLSGRLKPDGSLFLLYLSLYSLGRFAIEFTRALPNPGIQISVGPLHEAHFIALLVMAVCIPLLIRNMRQARRAAIPTPDAGLPPA